MMECSVRFVCETAEKDGRTIQIAGVKPALCVRGKKNALAVINDDLWVRTIELTLQDHDKASYVLYHGEPYDPKAFADRFLMAAKAANKPMTRRSKHLLTLREQADEDSLPQELLEREPVEQERIYAENTPKERQKAAQRPSPVKDLTKEYEGKLYATSGAMPSAEDSVAQSAESSGLRGLLRKPPKKVTRADVKQAHEAARKVIEKPLRVHKNSAANSHPVGCPCVKCSDKGMPKAKPNGSGKPAAERGTLIKRLAAEMKMEPFDLRVLIRSTGMRAPYEDEAKVRDAVKRGKKLLAGAKKK